MVKLLVMVFVRKKVRLNEDNLTLLRKSSPTEREDFLAQGEMNALHSLFGSKLFGIFFPLGGAGTEEFA